MAARGAAVAFGRRCGRRSARAGVARTPSAARATTVRDGEGDGVRRGEDGPWPCGCGGGVVRAWGGAWQQKRTENRQDRWLGRDVPGEAGGPLPRHGSPEEVSYRSGACRDAEPADRIPQG